MIELPALEHAARVRLRREGGVAPVPARAQPRDIDLSACSEQRRRSVCDALAAAAAQAGSAGGGDQRYFHVEILFEGIAAGIVAFEVPEGRAPDALLEIWKRGAGP